MKELFRMNPSCCLVKFILKNYKKCRWLRSAKYEKRIKIKRYRNQIHGQNFWKLQSSSNCKIVGIKLLSNTSKKWVLSSEY